MQREFESNAQKIAMRHANAEQVNQANLPDKERDGEKGDEAAISHEQRAKQNLRNKIE
jgi:hypothetical protein